MTRARGATVLVVLVTLLAACSGDDGGEGATRGTPAPGTGSTTTTGPATDDEVDAGRAALTLVSLNVLHGVFCDDGDHCDAPNRVALLARHVEGAGCPHVVALQEVAPWMRDLVTAQEMCDGAYAAAFHPGDGFDGLMVLSRLPLAQESAVTLAGGLRAALKVRLDAPAGPVDLVVTHTGTGADDRGAGGTACADDTGLCPPPCDPAGSVFECQLVQLRTLVGGEGTAIVAGDLNLVADAPAMSILYDAGFVDTWLAAGNSECDPATGAGCTSGRVDDALEILRQPSAQNSARVDYVLLRPGRCDARYGDATGPFAHEPATDGPGGLAWVSDHTGVALELECA